MNHLPRRPFALLLVSGALAACAGAPTTSDAPAITAASDCRSLAAEIHRTQEARAQALQQQQDAWKVIVPFAVAARHASAKSAVGDADDRLATLNAEARRRGCAMD